MAGLDVGPIWAGVELNYFFYYFNLIYGGRQRNRLYRSRINRDLSLEAVGLARLQKSKTPAS